eukprot:6931774-Prymnesium_polylepis.1
MNGGAGHPKQAAARERGGSRGARERYARSGQAAGGVRRGASTNGCSGSLGTLVVVLRPRPRWMDAKNGYWRAPCGCGLWWWCCASIRGIHIRAVWAARLQTECTVVASSERCCRLEDLGLG